jgi:putative transposase
LATISKAYKFRIYPNQKQQRQLRLEFAASKKVYNYYLEKSIEFYKENKDNLEKKSLNYYDWCKDLTLLKKTEEWNWLNQACSQTMPQTLRDLDSAYKNFFRRIREGKGGKEIGFPNFKKFNGSVRYSNICCKYSRENHKISLSKCGWVKVIDYKPAYGKLMNMTVSRSKSNNWFVSICVEQEEKIYENLSESMIGIDVGIKDFLVDSNGNRISNPKYLNKSSKRLNKLQRQLSKKKIGSNNRKKARVKLARQHEIVAEQRKNFLNQNSTNLVKNNKMIAHEDLKVKNMIKNHKLAKSISDVSWYEFFRMLEYKGNWCKCKIVKTGTFEPTSKRCNNCGYVIDKLGLEIREWECPNCHVVLDRDVNAAKNILELGIKGT